MFTDFCPDDDIHLNGWFSDYIIVVRGGSTIFNVCGPWTLDSENFD